LDRRALRNATSRPADELTVAPLALDGLAAALAKQMGFDAVYLGGGALGYARGVSEALLTSTEVADVVRIITERVDINVIVDGTTGFGDPVHVARTVRLVEQAGAAAIEIEDQPAPKRAHHQKHQGGNDLIIPIRDMADKVSTAVAARQDPDFLVIARCNALYNDRIGMGEAIERCNAYTEAGADMLLLFPRSPEELHELSAATTLPLVLMTPISLARSELVEAGYTLFCDAVSATVAGYQALKAAYAALKLNLSIGDSIEDLLAPLREIGETIDLQALYDIEARTTERALYSAERKT
jgi:2-methylisocitrate lyase-like PEP mutase family enzyme